MARREYARSYSAGRQIELAIAALQAASKLLSEAQIVPQSLSDTDKHDRVFWMGNAPLCLQFGGNRAEISIVEDTLTFQGGHEEGQGSEDRVFTAKSCHLGITLRIDVETAS